MARNWLLHGLHLVLTLFIPLILFLALGCSVIKEEKADYGTEVSGDAIDHALAKAVQGASLDDVKVGQFLDHTVNRRIENEETTTTLGGTRVEVVSKQETATTVKFTLRITKSERMAGGVFETKVMQEPLILSKGSLQTAGDRYTAAGIANEARAMSGVKALAKKLTKVTYHNLSEFTESMEAPKAVRARADCGGLNPCTLQIRYIRFDMVQWYDDGSSSKVALDFGFSIQPPFLPFGENFDQFSGLMVVDCRSTYVPIENRTVYVRDCMTLDDFQK